MTESQYFIDALKTFAKKTHVRHRLSFFMEEEIQAWEKWFQLEFAYFLMNGQRCEVWLEDSFDRDGRTTEKKINRMDLTYRRPNTSNEHYVGLEMKIRNDPEDSIRRAIVDLRGVAEIKQRDWCFRSIISVAMYLNKDKTSKYLDLIDSEGCNITIGKYTAAILCWESRTLENADLENYKDWFSTIKGLV